MITEQLLHMITEPLFEIVIDDEVVYRVYENGEYVYIDNGLRLTAVETTSSVGIPLRSSFSASSETNSLEHICELGFWDFG